MRYLSTRGGETGVPFERALLSAYASDGGLYVPEYVPQIPVTTLRSWATLTMSQVCARVMEQYTDLSITQLEQITAAAFGTFNGGMEPPLPCEKLYGDLHFLDTGLGPTLAFKDIGTHSPSHPHPSHPLTLTPFTLSLSPSHPHSRPTNGRPAGGSTTPQRVPRPAWRAC